jgi:septal ring factor EnvC (AmiA/AmiB activator)
MGDLDPLSQLVGQLQADAANAERSRAYLRNEIEKLSGTVNQLSHQITELTQTCVIMNKRIASVETDLRPISEFKQRSIGVIAVVMMILGALGSLVMEVMKPLLGKVIS